MEELTYTWKITSLSKTSTEDLSDVVVQTYWTVTGTDSEGRQGVFHGATPFESQSVDAENFVPFSELREQTVVDWLKQIVVDSYWEHVDAHIRKEIQEQKFQVDTLSEDSFPWSEPEPESQETDTDTDTEETP